MFVKAVLVLFLCFAYGKVTSTPSEYESDKFVIPDKFFPDLVEIIGLYLNISINHGFQNFPLEKPLLNLTEFKIPDVAGTFNSSRENILQGLNTLSLTKNPNITFPTNDKEDYYITLGKMELKQLSLSFTKYEMDFGITKQLPLYGNGNILLGIKDISLEIDASFNKVKKVELNTTSNKWVMTDLKVPINFRHSGVTVTGFFNNNQLDPYLSSALTLLESIVAALWNYNVDLISCVLGDIGKFVVNQYLFKNDPKINLPSDCLENASPQFLNALYQAKRDKNVGAFLTLITEEHVESFIAFFNKELLAAL